VRQWFNNTDETESPQEAKSVWKIAAFIEAVHQWK